MTDENASRVKSWSPNFKVVDVNKYKRFMFFLMMATMVGVFDDGLVSNATGAASFSLIPALHLVTTQFAFLAAVLYLGGIPGALLFGYFGDRYGRKQVFIITLVLLIIFEALSAIATSFAELAVFRFFAGVAVGADFVLATVYYNEFSIKESRGHNYMVWFGMFGIGFIAALLLGFGLYPTGLLDWRLVYALSIIPPATAIFLRVRLPESPRYLATHGGSDKLGPVLAMYGLDVASGIQVLMEPVKKTSTLSKVKQIRPYIFVITIPVFIIAFVINIPLVGLGLLGPLYLGLLHLKAPYTDLFTILDFGIPILLGAFIGSALIDRIGRFWLLMISSVGGGALFIIEGFLSHPSTAYFALVDQAAAITLIWFGTPIAYNIGTELYPTDVRGVGNSISVFATRLGGYLGPTILALFLTAGGKSDLVAFVLFAMLLFVMALVVAFWGGKRLDTTHKELEEVVDEFVSQGVKR